MKKLDFYDTSMKIYMLLDQAILNDLGNKGMSYLVYNESYSDFKKYIFLPCSASARRSEVVWLVNKAYTLCFMWRVRDRASISRLH